MSIRKKAAVIAMTLGYSAPLVTYGVVTADALNNGYNFLEATKRAENVAKPIADTVELVDKTADYIRKVDAERKARNMGWY